MRQDYNRRYESNRENQENRGERRNNKQKRLMKMMFVFAGITLIGGMIIGNKWGRYSEHKVMNEEVSTLQGEVEGYETKITSGEEKAAVDIANEEARNEELSSWYLRLVNGTHPLSEDEVVDLAEVENGHMVDARILSALNEMLAAGRAEGLTIKVYSTYRDWERQINGFNNTVQMYRNGGESYYDSFNLAQEYVAFPGTSEHQLGLALDIISDEYEELDERQADTDVARWLAANSYQYGFILRYPEDKEAITGKKYEPWHYRYVGVEAATEITEAGITLEEYHEQ